MKTWMQAVRRTDSLPSKHSDDLRSSHWEDPTAQFHVYVGHYSVANRTQITIIMAGKPYTFASEDDVLGKRIASGTLEEMQEVYETYARML